MTIATTTATQSLTVDGVGPVDVTFTERGAGRPFLMLHGGAGPPSVSGFADLLAETERVRVITLPTPVSAAPPARTHSTLFAGWLCSTSRCSTSST